MKYVVPVIALLVTLGTVLPFLKREEWWIRDLDFPRVQLLILGALSAFGMVYYRGVEGWFDTVVTAGLIYSLVYQSRRILPYTRLAPVEVLPSHRHDQRSTLSILVANVLMTNDQYGRLIRIIEENDPEIVLLLEPDSRWEREMRVIESRYPKVVRRALDNTYGMLLYSRLELVQPEVRYVIKRDIPSIHTQVRLGSGQLVWLHCLHPEPPSPTEAAESTPRDAELIVVGKEVRERGEPAIVCGDLNDVAWSLTTSLFQKISGLLDPRKGRGMFSTFHAKFPMMRWPLDHVFVSEHFRHEDLRRLGSFGSDHFPVYARVTFEPERSGEQEKPRPDAEDQKDAQEKIEKAR